MQNIVKQIIAFSFIATSVSSFAQVYSGYPDIPVKAVGFASEVVLYKVGTDKVISPQNDPARALGEPDQLTVSLGGGGTLVLSTGDLTLFTGGTNAPDFYVYEHNVVEHWDTYVSKDNITWKKIAPASTQSNSTGSVYGYDLDSLGAGTNGYPYIKMIDTSFDASSASSGTDIDAVVLTTAKFSGSGKVIDTDSRNGIVYNLEKSVKTGAVVVKKISKDGHVDYIPFSTDDGLEPIALSVQGDFNCNDEKDINVLVTRKVDNVSLNIIKDQQGNTITTVDNSVKK